MVGTATPLCYSAMVGTITVYGISRLTTVVTVQLDQHRKTQRNPGQSVVKTIDVCLS